MERYEGTQTERIVGGGSHEKKNEVCNFATDEAGVVVYGYVQPGKGTRIDISRLGARKGDKSISGITVVWAATRPKFGRVVVGWYKQATVYRDFQKFETAPPCHKKSDLSTYNIEASASDAHLLPLDERTLPLPRGRSWMGEANVWYADAPERESFRRQVKDLIRGKRNASTAKSSRQRDPKIRAAVEKAAIDRVRKHYEDIGYSRVESVETDNKGWDLEAYLGEKIALMIEVKGLSGDAASVELTPNEYTAFQGDNESCPQEDYRLCIVCSALTKNSQLLACRYSAEQRKWVVEGNSQARVAEEPKTGATIKVVV